MYTQHKQSSFSQNSLLLWERSFPMNRINASTPSVQVESDYLHSKASKERHVVTYQLLGESKKKIFPHLGSAVLVAPPNDYNSYLYHPIEKIVGVEWTLAKRKGYYKQIEFTTDHGNIFYLDDAQEGRVRVLWVRKRIERGFDTYYKNKYGEVVRNQIIHPKGDLIFEGVAT